MAIYLKTVLLTASILALGIDRATAQAPGGSPEADALFRQLDADSNGRITLDEGQPGSRGMRQQIFTMAGKQPNDSVSRAEFQFVFDQVRGGRGAPSTNNPRPMPTGTNPLPPGSTQPPTPRPTSTGTGTSTRTNAANQNTGPQVWRGWVVTGQGENPNEGQMQLELTIAGNRIVGREVGTNRAPGGLGSGTFVMQPAPDGKSGTLDALQSEGQNAGKNYMGIYAIEGDTLRWCVSNNERRRPTELASMGATQYLMVLRRVGAPGQ